MSVMGKEMDMNAVIGLNPFQVQELQQASQEGNLERVRAVLEAGAQPADLTRALILASSEGHVEVMKALLEAGAAPGGTDPNGNTSLHHAAHNNQVEAVRLLLESGVGVNQKGALASTPLHLALVRTDGDVRDRSEVIAVLLAAGADPNVRNEQGLVPLDMALSYARAPGGVKVFSELATGGANLNLQDTLGNTVLHRAAYDVHEEIVTILLDAGADIKKRNKDWKTPADVAANRANDFPADSDYTRRLIALAAAIKAREKKHGGLFGFGRHGD